MAKKKKEEAAVKSSNLIYHNKTVYTKEFYKSVALYKAFNKETFYLKLFAILLVCMYGVRLAEAGDKTLGIILILFGMIGVPLLLILVPYLYDLGGYKRSKKQMENNVVMELIVRNENIEVKNNLGQRRIIEFKNVNRVRGVGNVIMLQENKGGNPMYFDVNGFEVGSGKLFVTYMEGRCKNQLKITN